MTTALNVHERHDGSNVRTVFRSVRRALHRVGVPTFVFLVSFVYLVAPRMASAQPGQSEFVPMKEVPPGDQLPAAPLLIAAYAFVWVAAMFYLWTIWRRLQKVDTDMQALARRSAERSGTR